MSQLEGIIDASTDSSVATADLLRKVQIVASRLGATDIVDWVKRELNGYPDDAELPPYRVMSTGVMGIFSGPMRSTIHHQLTVVPKGFEDWWIVRLRQPLAELQGFSSGSDEDPTRDWPAAAVHAYEETGAFHIEFHGLFSARNVIPRQSLIGLIDVVRSRVLEFALELQAKNPEAGNLGGPTVQTDPALASTVLHITNNIYGDGAQVASGETVNHQGVSINGDANAFREFAARIIQDDAVAEEFVEAVAEEKDLEAPRVRAILDRVRAGGVRLAEATSGSVAATALLELARRFIG